MSDSGEPIVDSLTHEQLEFAAGLGLKPAAGEDASAFIMRIEQCLGQESLLELARWFLLSVMQHLQHRSWESLADSGLSKEQQYQLAAEYIAKDEHKKSLLVVLKDQRFRFALLSFAKGRDPERRVLSSTTKAFRHGREILLRHELIDTQALGKRGRKPAQKSSKAADTIASRRAARRAANMVAPEKQLENNSSNSADKQPLEMSEEEFVELDAALKGAEFKGGKPWTYQTNDERISLLLGVLAGGTLFVAALWAFS